MMECASLCLDDNHRCISYEFNSSTKTCRLSDNAVMQSTDLADIASQVFEGTHLFVSFANDSTTEIGCI